MFNRVVNQCRSGHILPCLTRSKCSILRATRHCRSFPSWMSRVRSSCGLNYSRVCALGSSVSSANMQCKLLVAPRLKIPFHFIE